MLETNLGNLRFSVDSLKDEISKAGLRNDRNDNLDFVKIRTFLTWKAFLGRWEGRDGWRRAFIKYLIKYWDPKYTNNA